MRISDYDYNLPDERIAQHPPQVRGTTRLLTLNRQTGDISHRGYTDMADYLEAGDVVVLNKTKVIKARLLARNSQDQERELLLIESHGNEEPTARLAIYRGKLRAGETLTVGNTEVMVAAVLGGGLADITSDSDLLKLAETSGSVPLPPYMKRAATPDDQARYQTVFAQEAGSVAAPTASLNFTPELADKLTTKGVKIVYLTLHVGLGTFLPIRSDSVEDHVMHSEYYDIPAETVAAIQAAKKAGRRICAVGTTVARTLEYTASDILEGGAVDLQGEADIFIYPGYDFKVVDL
ncbi:MAG: S-adenosylmethionine:tRNA ribosyltransferase-isomerase [Patescibacteria group bacterium]|nr:S-adenosylmethionine:tRNA ribosyltransferase-isomerase [Patescibacteria group bacterium]